MKQSGFTLLEMLIVIGITSVLAAMLIPNIIIARRAANDMEASSFLRNIITLAEIKRADNHDSAAFATSAACASALSISLPQAVTNCEVRQDANATYGFVASKTGHYFHFDGQRVVGPLNSPPASW